MPLKLKSGSYSRYDNPRDREYHCSISGEDVIESEKHKQLVFISSACNKPLYYIKFEKEYECMFSSNEYNTPIRTIEKDNNKILVFNALGIPKENIEYKTEFVNRSKESYLVIQGSVELTDFNYKNGINIRIKIDTDIYDGYDIYIENGLIFVRLHEIVNEAPVLKDYGVA